MQHDGNFVLYNGRNPGSEGQAYWASNTNPLAEQHRALSVINETLTISCRVLAALGIISDDSPSFVRARRAWDLGSGLAASRRPLSALHARDALVRLIRPVRCARLGGNT
jgi:hypothetical protein